ncbi:NUDIX domain-containing protein [Actinomyces ruminis]|nr:NUDIX domain-containing protein [Actinomyces ruminis]
MSQCHFGVYARIVEDARMLCVRKTRGPYTGLLDLPGGRPEPGEYWEETLLRELTEELGVSSFTAKGLRRVEVHVTEDSRGNPIDFHHYGVVADVALADELPPLVPASSDTGGCQWHRLDDLSGLSALALAAARPLRT